MPSGKKSRENLSLEEKLLAEATREWELDLLDLDEKPAKKKTEKLEKRVKAEIPDTRQEKVEKSEKAQKPVKAQAPEKAQKPVKAQAPAKGSKKKGKKRKNKSPVRKAGKRVMRAVVLVFVFWFLHDANKWVSYTELEPIASLRDIYIGTAMTTHSHQWLATFFFPESVIARIMDQQSELLASGADKESDWTEDDVQEFVQVDTSEAKAFYEVFWELDSESFREYINKHESVIVDGYDNILIEDLDGELGILTSEGDQVLIVDSANNLIVVGIEGKADGVSYVGKLAIVKNPEQVEHLKARSFGRVGEEIQDFCESNGALIATNASAFEDPEGHGSGSTVEGACIFDGKEYGYPANDQRFYGMKYDDHLYVTDYWKINPEDFRWGVQFYPAMLINGENVIGKDGRCMGFQPRTSIGQAEDGTFMILVIDGRQPGYSMGCSVATCATILERYHAYQAANLDGGSSSVMVYKGEQITRSSSGTGRGRYCPDCLAIMPVAE